MAAPVWSDARLEADRTKAIAEFRDERLTEPLEAYLEVFESYRDAFDELLETTVDLTQLADNAVEVLTDARDQIAPRSGWAVSISGVPRCAARRRRAIKSHHPAARGGDSHHPRSNHATTRAGDGAERAAGHRHQGAVVTPK